MNSSPVPPEEIEAACVRVEPYCSDLGMKVLRFLIDAVKRGEDKQFSQDDILRVICWNGANPISIDKGQRKADHDRLRTAKYNLRDELERYYGQPALDPKIKPDPVRIEISQKGYKASVRWTSAAEPAQYADETPSDSPGNVEDVSKPVKETADDVRAAEPTIIFPDRPAGESISPVEVSSSVPPSVKGAKSEFPPGVDDDSQSVMQSPDVGLTLGAVLKHGGESSSGLPRNVKDVSEPVKETPDNITETIITPPEAPLRERYGGPRTLLLIFGIVALVLIVIIARPWNWNGTKLPTDPETQKRNGLTYVSIQKGKVEITCGRFDGDKCSGGKRVAEIAGFRIHRSPVSVKNYFKTDGSASAVARPDEPAANVRWSDASDFCQASRGRLPTADEWEYAAKTGTIKLEDMWEWTSDGDNQDRVIMRYLGSVARYSRQPGGVLERNDTGFRCVFPQ